MWGGKVGVDCERVKEDWGGRGFEGGVEVAMLW